MKKPNVYFKILIYIFCLLVISFLFTGCGSEKKSKVKKIILVSQTDEKTVVKILNAKTLKELNKKKNTVIAENYKAALSIDGGKVAVVHRKEGKKAVLSYIDTTSFKETRKNLKFDVVVSRIFFSDNNKFVYWIRSLDNGTKSKLKQSVLEKYDTSSSKIKQVYRFPKAFVPDKFHVNKDGKKVIVYGLNVNASLESTKAPSIYVFNLQTDNKSSYIALIGVKAGLSPSKTSSGTKYYQSFSPGLATDKDEKIMYITQPKNKISVVDLENGKMLENKVLTDKLSITKILLSMFEQSAEAETKVIPVSNQAVVNNDSSQVFDVSSNYGIEKSGSKSIFKQKFDGIKIINLETFEVIKKVKVDATNISLSPSNEWLLITGNFDLFSTSKKNGGLYLYNIKAGKIEKYLFNKVNVSIVGFDQDTNNAYAKVVTGLGGHKTSTIFAILDYEKRKLVKKNAISGYVNDILIQK